jgi:hypothetical protein
MTVGSSGPAADAARSEFRARVDAPGHTVENARIALAGLEAAFASGTLAETPVVGAMIADLRVAIDAGDDDRVGGKSAEAARFILRAISRELDAT